VLIFAFGSSAAEHSFEPVVIESGSASFEAGTNVPGIEVKGTSSSLSGRANVAHGEGGLLLEQVRVSLPVKSLATGMKLRDEHMRKYIFTTSGGQLPDVEFAADQGICRSATASGEFNCDLAGNLTIRGVSHEFHTRLTIKEQSSGAPATFHATGEALVKLSDYGIQAPTQFGVSASNEVKLRLSLVGRRDNSARGAQ